jgi:hypothetical protein
MTDAIICPACCEQFPYMPDLIGLQISCPRCSHPFIVNAPNRRARRRISEMPAPNFNIPSAPRRVTSVATAPAADLPLASAPADPDFEDLPHFRPDEDDVPFPESDIIRPTLIPMPRQIRPPARTYRDAPAPNFEALESAIPFAEPPSESSFDSFPQQYRMIVPPPPVIYKPTPIKPLPRIWTAGESACFQTGLTAICFGLFALLLPLSGLRLNYLGASAPLIFALVILFGAITCAFVMFRHHLHWVFMVTCLVLVLMIVSLYHYTATRQVF